MKARCLSLSKVWSVYGDCLSELKERPWGWSPNNSPNSPTGGAIDLEGADKAARFMQLCDAFDIPILSLVDTPGNMVGPEAENRVDQTLWTGCM